MFSLLDNPHPADRVDEIAPEYKSGAFGCNYLRVRS
jgi:hypothetical protein